ncbi:antitoxin MazE-like protein [Microbacterium invictum]|uniref:Antitoxin MazE-like protein n=1 Tax=Microbacterium invictum TaxID=515415 RepID=A0ABZ0VA60_9MICO|nr:antitoxin MazE-like protein [Microbacterium invictum]WQB69768.1 antitoxin MazE-like protein [Microbacterium invictum]
MAVRERVSEYRRRVRERGFRPVQVWVPDVRTPTLAAEAARQASLVAHADRESDDQAFVEAVAAPWDDE